MKRQLRLAAIAGLAFLGNANADVVVGTNVTFGGGSYLGQYSLTACQDKQCDYTTMWFNKTNYGTYSTLTPTTWNIDEEADYYLVPYGAEFSASTIAQSQFTPFFVFDDASSINVPFGTFYLGVNTGNSGNGWPPRDVFGWVAFTNSPTGLEMIGNAMAYDTNGIFIGTTNIVPVPEADTWALMLTGLSLVGAMARRRKQARI